MLTTRRLLTTVLGALLVLAATAVPGHAATRYLHMWVDDHYDHITMGRASYDTNFGNDFFCNPPGDKGWSHSDGHCDGPFTQEYGFDDSVSSIRNDTAYWWKMYEDKNYGGYVLCVRPRGYDNNLGNNTPVEDDISSVKRMNYDPDKNAQPGGCDQVVG